MPETSYVVAVLAIIFAINVSLRAMPFAALRTLRASGLTRTLAVWMPAGILGILAASTLRTTIDADASAAVLAMVAVAVTATVHLLAGRRTLVSVGIGTLTYVTLVTLF